MNKTDKQGELREAIYRAGRRYANSKQDAYAVVALQNEVELIYKNLMDGSKAQDVKSASLKDEEAHALAQEITNLRDDLEKRDTKFEELTEQKNNLMKQLLLEIGDGKIEKDKLQATHKKEVESIFQEFGTLVDLSKLPFILDVINSIKSKHLKASELRG